jgi:HD-GYP domain-containing protein (c-di-GMP phosphodiesterase class II)
MVLARPLLSEEGKLLLAEGVSLGESLIRRISEVGIPFVYVRDDRFPDDDRARPLISPQNQRGAVAMLHVTFAEMAASYESRVLAVRLGDLADLVRDLLREALSRPAVVVHLLDLRSLSAYEPQHALQTLLLSGLIGRAMGLPEAELFTLGLGAFLHDIGKVAVPSRILDKPGHLEPEEWSVIRRHPLFGGEILGEQGGVWREAARAALHHHERLDGSGYPEGLRGEAIPRIARIVAVADAYDAMTAARPYRPVPMPPSRALRALRSAEGTHLDPEVVKTLSSLVAPYPIGTWLRLSTGQIGVVVEVRPERPDKPVLSVVRNERTGPLPTPLRVDLSLAPDARISTILEDETEVLDAGEELPAEEGI